MVIMHWEKYHPAPVVLKHKSYNVTGRFLIRMLKKNFIFLIPNFEYFLKLFKYTIYKY